MSILQNKKRLKKRYFKRKKYFLDTNSIMTLTNSKPLFFNKTRIKRNVMISIGLKRGGWGNFMGILISKKGEGNYILFLLLRREKIQNL